jgi:hypothetical protein
MQPLSFVTQQSSASRSVARRVVRIKRMLTTPKLFQLLNEAIVLLLGALLILLALSGRVGLPTRPAALVALGIIFVYWGARAWVRREPAPVSSSSKIRAGSLVLVGLLVLGIPVFPTSYIPLLLGLAGAVLVFRGLLGLVLFVGSEEAR